MQREPGDPELGDSWRAEELEEIFLYAGLLGIRLFCGSIVFIEEGSKSQNWELVAAAEGRKHSVDVTIIECPQKHQNTPRFWLTYPSPLGTQMYVKVAETIGRRDKLSGASKHLVELFWKGLPLSPAAYPQSRGKCLQRGRKHPGSDNQIILFITTWRRIPPTSESFGSLYILMVFVNKKQDGLKEKWKRYDDDQPRK